MYLTGVLPMSEIQTNRATSSWLTLQSGASIMAKISLVKQAADMLITSYVDRLVGRVELAAARSSVAQFGGVSYPWIHFGDVEFISREEWDFLKVLTKIEDDETLTTQIYKNERFKSQVFEKYGFMWMEIVFPNNHDGKFCKIEAKDMTEN